jgi:hypothetical protein
MEIKRSHCSSIVTENDYMRDGPEVALPFTVPKDAFLKDLEYYGFENVDPNKLSIAASLDAFLASGDYLDALAKKKERDLKKQETDLKEQEMDLTLAYLAHFCFLRLKHSRSLSISFGSNYHEFSYEMKFEANLREFRRIARDIAIDLTGENPKTASMVACLNKHLNDYGLQLKSCSVNQWIVIEFAGG